MQVKMEDNKGAVRYRNVSFVGADPVEVTNDWFEACTNPRIVEVKATKAKKVKATSAD